MFVHELYIYIQNETISNSLKLSEFDRKRHLAVLERPFTHYLSNISVIFLFLYFRFRTGKIAILNMQTHSPLIYIYIYIYTNLCKQPSENRRLCQISAGPLDEPVL